MKNKLVHDALVLTMITVIAGAALGVVYEITKAPIAKAQEDALNKSYQEVFTDADSFTDVDGFDSEAASKVVADAGVEGVTIDFAKEAVDASGNALGYVIGVTSDGGYGGNISFTMGVTTDGTMTDYATTSISETAGLGMHAADKGEGTFESQWQGKEASTDYAVAKDGGDIVAISGATITSRCMTKGINGGFAYFQSLEGGAQ
ncbi:MAG: FMN-binding protein [Lachnospiraceae bacterium]|nr:FMN-binding protein [Lachnospiraceae bacterium]